MEHKFIRVISPITAVIVLFLDGSVLALGYYCIKKITEEANFYTISFAVIETIIGLVAVLTSAEVLKNGVRFGTAQLEFTGLDNNNVFDYDKLERVETHKDTKASFKKNFVNRYSSVILYLTDGNVATIELGMTTKRKLKKIENEINQRMNGRQP